MRLWYSRAACEGSPFPARQVRDVAANIESVFVVRTQVPAGIGEECLELRERIVEFSGFPGPYCLFVTAVQCDGVAGTEGPCAFFGNVCGDA